MSETRHTLLLSNALQIPCTAMTLKLYCRREELLLGQRLPLVAGAEYFGDQAN